MDLDFRASTIHSSNHLSSLQASRLHSENYSMFNSTDGDDDSQSLLRCRFCEFDIEVPVHHSRLEDVHCYDPKNMVCPVCDENLGEDAIRAAQNSILRRKRAWRSEKSSISSGNSAMLDKKFVVWGNRHEPMSDPLLSPFVGNGSVPSPSDVQSDDDSISNASDISNAKSISGADAPDTGDEQDHQERSLRASFVQELVFSTLSLAM